MRRCHRPRIRSGASSKTLISRPRSNRSSKAARPTSGLANLLRIKLPKCPGCRSPPCKRQSPPGPYLADRRPGTRVRPTAATTSGAQRLGLRQRGHTPRRRRTRASWLWLLNVSAASCLRACRRVPPGASGAAEHTAATAGAGEGAGQAAAAARKAGPRPLRPPCVGEAARARRFGCRSTRPSVPAAAAAAPARGRRGAVRGRSCWSQTNSGGRARRALSAAASGRSCNSARGARPPLAPAPVPARLLRQRRLPRCLAYRWDARPPPLTAVAVGVALLLPAPPQQPL
jgi:hypothetical protein